jgi:lactoylglutathione lyase
MPASLRIEIFPSDQQRCIDFYTDILQFKLIKRKDTYIYMRRDNIFIGAIETPSDETVAQKEAYRRPNKGVEIVFEVDDLEAERDRIVENGGKLEADIQVQEWGLEDFRLVDPDGYYLRVTTHSPKYDANGDGN